MGNSGLLRKTFYQQKGQSLLEVIVAVAVGILVVSALVFATIFSLRNANFAKNQTQATKYAQAGIERVRVGRDRNLNIIHSGALGNVSSWKGDINGNGAVWNYQINGNCGNTTINPPVYCYFNVSNIGELTYLSAATSMPSGAEPIPPPPSTPQFFRAVILSDDPSTYTAQKTITVIVRWSDFSGDHESRLTTILRKL